MHVSAWRFEANPEQRGVTLVLAVRRRAWQVWLPSELAVTFPRSAAVGFYQALAKYLRAALILDTADTLPNAQEEFTDDVRRALGAINPLPELLTREDGRAEIGRALANLLAQKGYGKR